MRISQSLLALLVVCTCVCSGVVQAAEDIPPQYNVGYQVLDFAEQGAAPLTVAVWYPTTAQPREFNYGGPVNGKLAPDAAPLSRATPFPLLVFSHGFGGSGLSSVFITEALAAQGWIVVCPDHHDAHSAVRIRGGQQDFDRRGMVQVANRIAASSPADRDQYLYRVQEMQRTLQGILESRVFGPLINRQQIAVGGHSFGGFTALGLSGPLPQYYDPRIKAILLFSTGAGAYLYTQDELQRVHIPLMLLVGEKEREQKRGTNTMAELSTRIFEAVSAPRYLLEVRGANHFSFNNGFKSNWASRWLSGSETGFAVIRRYGIAFLQKYVAGDNGFNYIIEATDPQLSRYIKK